MNPRIKLLIPTVMLVATIVSGAYASFLVTSIHSDARVKENVSVRESQEFTPEEFFPGESATWVFTVMNDRTLGSQTVQINFFPSPASLPQGISYTVGVTGDGLGLDPCITSATGSASCSGIVISAGGGSPFAPGTVTVTVTLSAASDAAAGSSSSPVRVTITADILRV